MRNFAALELNADFSDFFDITEKKFKAKEFLLDNVNFTNENFQESTTESSYDLILYRNRLIYFSTNLQSKILKKIHNMLSKGGYLILGIGENLLLHSDIKINTADKTEKIFKKSKF